MAPASPPRSQPAASPPDAPAELPAGRRRRAWLITAMIVAFMVVNFADKSVLGLAALPIMHELHLSHSTYGLISSCFFLLFSLSGLVVGFLSSRFSTRRLLFAMTLLWAVAQLPVLMVATVPALVVGRLLLGAAEGPAAAMSMHALYTWFPPGRRGLPSALHIGGAALGTLIAAPVVTWLITAHGWRSAFAALAAASALWSLLWWRIGHDGPYGPAHESPARESTAQGAPARGGYRLPYRRILRTGTVLGSISSAFGAQWALSLSSTWLPAYLRTQLPMTPERAATTISAVSAFGFVLLLTVSPLVDALRRRGVSHRWSSGALQGGAVCVAGAAMAAFPFVHPTGPRLVLLAAAFGCASVAIPLHYITTAEVVPTAQRGAVFGIVAATGTLPGLLAPALTGHFIDASQTPAAGYTTSFLITAVVMLLAGAFAVAAIRPEHDARRLRPAWGD